MFDICERFKWLNKKFHLNSALPFIALVSYTLVGAAIFRSLELEKDRTEREHFRNAYREALNQTALTILKMSSGESIDSEDTIDNEKLKRAINKIQWLFNYLNLTHTINEKSEASPWSWYGSMFYAGQLYTTIGYGIPVAKTRAGQIASIFYILAGIPIFLIILKNVGVILSKAFRKLYKRISVARNKLPQNTYIRRMSTPVKGIYRSSCSIFLTNIHVSRKSVKTVQNLENGKINTLAECSDNRSKTDTFPIPIAFGILIIWIFSSAALFCLWETQWGFMTSVYFFFVSISTVGLGDIIPSNKDMMLANFVLILFGLALLSMCFNVIQVTVERMLDQFLQQCIEEIEKVATLINKQGAIDGSVRPPLLKHEKNGLKTKLKEWFAGKLVNKLISSKLQRQHYDSDSEDDVDSLLYTKEKQIHREAAFLRHGHWLTYKFRKNPSLLKALRMLRKFRDFHDKDHFKSVLFFKLITNEKFDRIITDCCTDENITRLGSYTQPDSGYIVNSSRLATPESDVLSEGNYWVKDKQRLQYGGSVSTFESIYSKAYNDIQFGNSYTSSWTELEHGSQLLQRSEGSLEYVIEDNYGRAEVTAPKLPLHSLTKAVFEQSKSSVQQPSASANLHHITNHTSFRRKPKDQSLLNNVPSFYGKIFPKSTVLTDEPILNRVRNVVGIMPDDFRRPPFTYGRRIFSA